MRRAGGTEGPWNRRLLIRARPGPLRCPRGRASPQATVQAGPGPRAPGGLTPGGSWGAGASVFPVVPRSSDAGSGCRCSHRPGGPNARAPPGASVLQRRRSPGTCLPHPAAPGTLLPLPDPLTVPVLSGRPPSAHRGRGPFKRGLPQRALRPVVHHLRPGSRARPRPCPHYWLSPLPLAGRARPIQARLGGGRAEPGFLKEPLPSCCITWGPGLPAHPTRVDPRRARRALPPHCVPACSAVAPRRRRSLSPHSILGDRP